MRLGDGRRSELTRRSVMGLPDNIFGSDKSSPVPGGSVAKPLVIALLARLVSRYMSGKGNHEPGTPPPAPPPRSPDPVRSSDPSPGSVLDGLGGLIKQFQQKGLND